VSQSFVSVFPIFSDRTMAIGQTCYHLPVEILNLSASAANRARIDPTHTQLKICFFLRFFKPPTLYAYWPKQPPMLSAPPRIIETMNSNFTKLHTLFVSFQVSLWTSSFFGTPCHLKGHQGSNLVLTGSFRWLKYTTAGQNQLSWVVHETLVFSFLF
jgi:hypothetical protein